MIQRVVDFDLDALVTEAIVVRMQDGAAGNEVQSPPAAQQDPARPELCTDLGNAFRLTREHGDGLRHVAGWGWLAWDGRRWLRDEKAVFNLAKTVAVRMYDDAQALKREAGERLAGVRTAAVHDPLAQAAAIQAAKALQQEASTLERWAKQSQSAGKIEAAVKLAVSEPALTALPEQFDADPWLLNCSNGTMDLRSAALRPHCPEDLISGLAPVAYDPAATCPAWDAFLARIMGGKEDLIRFLQRAVGYSLTGSVSEQVLFFLYGSGANGKSTFLKAILSLLGRDYAKQAAPEVLTLGAGRHPTEIADLAGARFVASVEVTEGKRLAEALVKQLTGGDPVKARLMRQDFFQFDPAFKLWLAANHKPVVKGTDHAIWRRIRLVPFTVTIAEVEQDKRLGEKLEAELPGILAWAVRGCLDWQRNGLGVPAEVLAATEAYRAESDELAPFFEECITVKPQAQAQAGPLYSAYRAWAEANGVAERERLSNVKFGQRLVERGFSKHLDKSSRQTFYTGLAVQERE